MIAFTAEAAFQAVIEWVVLAYFVGLNAGYLLLDAASIAGIREYVAQRATETLPRAYTGLEPPISMLVPAYNEEAAIVPAVRALLQLRYHEFEIIVVNDGSTDATIDRLRDAFDLEPFPEALPDTLPTEDVRGVYRSRRISSLRVVDKANGGKADALNCAINAARFPLVCAVDADSILQPDSLQRVVRPFMEDSRTVASGGTIRIANGCEVSGGFLVRAGLPRNPIALFQIVEYLRAFLFGRLGWSPLNALLIISGAFGLFRRSVLVEAGGYRRSTIGEDMELVVRLHRTLRRRKVDYRIAFLPDPICWTEAPEDLATLGRQRIRWQRGLLEALWANKRLLFSHGSGAVGWLAFPFFLFFEAAGPVIELTGYVYFTLGVIFGFLDPLALVAFLLAAIGLGLLLSVTAVLLEEMSFHVYPRPRQVAALVAACVAENLGYRQLNALWRVIGVLRWLRRKRGGWGEMRRTGASSSGDDDGHSPMRLPPRQPSALGEDAVESEVEHGIDDALRDPARPVPEDPPRSDELGHPH